MFENYVGSQYVCIREESSTQCGILLRVIGKAAAEHIHIVAGVTFCEDDYEEKFHVTRYFSHPMVLSIKTIVFFVSECLNQIDLTSVFFFLISLINIWRLLMLNC